MSKQKPVKVALVNFGKGGHGLYYREPGYSNCHLSGYENPDTFMERVEKGEYQKYILEGALCVDIRAVVTVKNVFASPLVSADLEPGKVDRFNMEDLKDSIMVQAMEADPGNGFGDITRAAKLGLGSLDTVAPDVYVGWWKAQGARVGAFEGGEIVWGGE